MTRGGPFLTSGMACTRKRLRDRRHGEYGGSAEKRNMTILFGRK